MKSGDKILITVAVLIIASFFIFFRNVSLYELSEDGKVFNSAIDAVKCLPEERNVNACIEIYNPVCGSVRVECITTPCNPVKQTFSNSCFACQNERVSEYFVGEC